LNDGGDRAEHQTDAAFLDVGQLLIQLLVLLVQKHHLGDIGAVQPDGGVRVEHVRALVPFPGGPQNDQLGRPPRLGKYGLDGIFRIVSVIRPAIARHVVVFLDDGQKILVVVTALVILFVLSQEKDFYVLLSFMGMGNG
jgi:hypothetical protein